MTNAIHSSDFSEGLSVSSDIAYLSAAIDAYPASFSGNPLNLLSLNDAKVIESPRKYLQQLDAPTLTEERREYLLHEYPEWPFPSVVLRDRPDPRQLSQQLFTRFEYARQVMPTQRDIARILQEAVQKAVPDFIVLMIVDGLSYFDLPDGTDTKPCLVDGVSTTEFGYRQVIGSPDVARRLFELGYHKQLAFTYFPLNTNILAQHLHTPFSNSRVIRVRAFEEVMARLRREKMRRGYIQVSLAGLDQLCHSHRDRPPREHYLGEILSRFEGLLDCLKSKGRPILGCMTADHGILWRDEIEDQMEIVHDLFSEDVRSPRYVRGCLLRDYGRCCECMGQNYTLLRYPCLTRNLKNNEWGIHGGISAWESVVPLLIRLV